MVPDTVESSDEIVSLLKNIFLNLLLRQSTGVVIAGFNEEDMFPSLINFDLCFNNNGNIEIIDDHELINYDGCGIIPFAQKDVIYNYLTGIDFTMSDSIVAYFNNFIKKFLSKFIYFCIKYRHFYVNAS